jgi:DNA excision repair protein ERCC-6
MPGKKEQVLFCRLTDQQRMMYEAFLRSDIVKGVFRGTAQLLGAITTLRKICNHPDLVCPSSKSSLDAFLQNGFVDQNELLQDPDSDLDDFFAKEGEDDEDPGGMSSLTGRSGKLEVLAKILPLWKKQGHRVLIFCQWRKMLDVIMQFVKLQGWKYSRLDGNTNVASRQRLVNKFNSDDSFFVMLCTTRTGGVGLNLVGVSFALFRFP